MVCDHVDYVFPKPFCKITYSCMTFSIECLYVNIFSLDKFGFVHRALPIKISSVFAEVPNIDLCRTNFKTAIHKGANRWRAQRNYNKALVSTDDLRMSMMPEK
jgi:hypothetical protein